MKNKKNKKKTFKEWLQEHKKELIIGGVSIFSLAAIIKFAESHDIEEFVYSLLEKTTDDNEGQLTISSEELVEYDNLDNNAEEPEKDVYMVSEHIRNLPEGWQASINKINTAEERGITLNPSQTWVESYQKGGCVA